MERTCAACHGKAIQGLSDAWCIWVSPIWEDFFTICVCILSKQLFHLYYLLLECSCYGKERALHHPFLHPFLPLSPCIPIQSSWTSCISFKLLNLLLCFGCCTKSRGSTYFLCLSSNQNFKVGVAVIFFFLLLMQPH